MRRFRALAHASTMEALSGPLSSVLFLVGTLVVHLSSVFHYHQFGDPLRLPHECGLSALFVFGLLFATGAAFRTVGYELVSGIASVALTRPLGRSVFFCAKIFGVFVALAVFLLSVFSASVLSCMTASIGQLMSMQDGTTRLWPLGVKLGILAPILGFFMAAFLNRFFRVRFCFSSCILIAVSQAVALLVALAANPFSFEATGVELTRMIRDFACMTAACCAFIAMSGALSARLRPSFASGLAVMLVISSFLINIVQSRVPVLAYFLRAFLPDLGKVWMPQDFAMAVDMFCASVAVTVIWLTIGSLFVRGKEIP